MATDRGGGPLRRALRRRRANRLGMASADGLAPVTLELGGRARTYLLAAPSTPAAPLLVVLHGAGSSGAGMARLTGLGERARAAGVAAVFPDGVNRVWSDNRGAPRLRTREGVDDVGFLAALIERLAGDGVIDPRRVVLAGISNGALLAEHIARHARLPVAGVVLVAGTATVPSRQAQLRPRQATRVVIFHGTADPLVPYLGGPIGPAGRMAQRRARRRGGEPGRGVAVPVDTVAADWAAVAGAAPAPETECLPMPAGDLAVTRLTWRGSANAVTLHRIEGGGHTWPGGPQYLPARIVGPVARGLDASAATIAVAAGEALMRRCAAVLVLVAVTAVAGVGCGGSSPATLGPHPRFPPAFAMADLRLRNGLRAWRASDPALLGPPPAAVLAAAAQERELVHRLAQSPARARRTLSGLPLRVSAPLAADVAAARDLQRLAGPPSGAPAPVLHLVAPRPAGELLADYRRAQRRFGVQWQVLAAVNLIETAFGRVKNRSSAGAQGPMQFLPATWRAYGLGGDINSPRDAILGAANYLHQSGAPADDRRAVYAYNHSTLYVDAVLTYARQMTRDPLAYLRYYAWEASLPATLGG